MGRRTHRLTAAALAGMLAILSAAPAGAEAAAFWRSLLIPGWGQQATGQDGAAARFFAVEAGLWAGWLGLRAVADVRRQTYRTWAAAHAGAQPGGKTKVWFDDVGFYASHHQHNLFAVVDDGPQAELYPDTAEFAWSWDADASRERFRTLRNDATSMERNALYATGLLLVNHLVSAIHAGRAPADAGPAAAGSAAAGSAASGSTPGLSLESRLLPGGVGLALTRRF